MARKDRKIITTYENSATDIGNDYMSGVVWQSGGNSNTPTEPKTVIPTDNGNTSIEPVSDISKGITSTEPSDVTVTQNTITDNTNETSNNNTSTESINVTDTGNNDTVNTDDSNNSNTETSNGSETINSNQSTEHVHVTSNSNNTTVTKDVILLSNTSTKDENVNVNHTTVKDVTDDLMNMFQEKQNRPTVEETHVRATFLFNRDLDKRLNKLAKGKRGFKTMFLNKAIESLLNEMEGK